MNEDCDWKGRRVSDFIGRHIDEPAGKIIGGCIDAVGVMLLDIDGDDGTVYDNIPFTVVYLVP